MAIIQISKIQQRSGNLVDLPQLDQGEFGWASDSGRLFIGKTAEGSNIENVEVLTSYSNISFSQLDGSSGNLDINADTLEEGQVLAYDAITDSWVNRGGSGVSAGGKINLGNVSNVTLTGGGIGYVLSTDGTGNLSWTPKNALYTNIIQLTNDNPIVMTVSNLTPYVNSQQITITGVTAANANTIVNGKTFYVKLDPNFTSNSSVTGSGNVTLYTDQALTVTVNGTNLGQPTANGVATSSLAGGGGGGGSGIVGGANTSIQYNNSGVPDGSANLTFDFSTNILYLNGNALVGNITSNYFVSSNVLVSTVITGTAPLTVTSTTEVANLFVYKSNIAGTVITAAQPNITSVGTLSTLSVSGNANVGNLGTTGVYATTLSSTGNANVGNLGVTGVYSTTLSSTGNANVGNLGVTGVYATTLSSTGNANTGNVNTTGVFATTLSSTGNANVGNLGVSGLITATGSIRTSSTLSAVGNANVGNIGATNGVFTTISGSLSTGSQSNITAVGTLTTLSVSGNGTFGNVAGGNLVSANFITGTLTTSAQPNITSVGTLATLSVSGNANVGNIGATLVVGNLSGSGNSNVGNLGTSGLITATGNIRGANLVTTGVVSATGKVTSGAVNYANTDGTNGQLLTTYGNGTTYWSTISSTSISNGTSNVNIATSGGNVTTSVAGNANIIVVTGTGANVNGTLSVSGNISGSGNIYVSGDITSASDITLKEDVYTITNALDIVSSLRGVRYKLKETQQQKIGLIANEVLKIVPEVVGTNSKYLGINYGSLVGVLVEAIKELKAEIDILKGGK